jgi:hypothetical protein
MTRINGQFELLQETPQTRKNNCSFEEGYKILEAAERQIQHWLQQLSVNKGGTPTNTPATSSPKINPVNPATASATPSASAIVLPTNPR